MLAVLDSTTFRVIEAVGIFMSTYSLIVSEKFNRTVAVMLGMLLTILVGLMSLEDVIHSIDFETIGLLIGMMVIIGIVRRTGLFEYLAIKCVKIAHGNPHRVMIGFGVITAVSSALLDNVTTVMLMVPITFMVTRILRAPVMPFLISLILASNVGGTATLIGDPPNIMIGSAAHLGFTDFIVNLGPPIIVIVAVTMGILGLLYRKHLVALPERQMRVQQLDEKAAIKDPVLLKKVLVVLALTLAGFFLHQMLGLETVVVAFLGATIMLLVTGVEPNEAFADVEWATIFFFVGLFALVGALQKVGAIAWISSLMVEVTGENYGFAASLILWVSGLLSGIVDNIPFIATTIPVLQDLSGPTYLWWALSLGACLGGNMTLVGASANVVVAGLAKEHGCDTLTFKEYLKVGVPLTVLGLALAHVYLMIRFL